MNLSDLLRHAVELARAGKKEAACDVFLRVVEIDPRNELAWMWLAGLAESLEDQIVACENVLTINPANRDAQAFLAELEQRKSTETGGGNVEKRPSPKKLRASKDPFEEAKYLEQDGKLNEALMIYKMEAAKAKDTQTFNDIYNNIVRVEKNQAERIQYVSPRASIIRLTFAWPLLYLSLALVQVGLKPLEHLTSFLWFAFPWVVLGSYLIAISEIRSRHPIWKRIFLEQSDGSALARVVIGVLGWLMVIVPMVLLVLDSLNRLADFQIPARLF